MRQWIKVALVVLLAVAVINDVGRYLTALYRIDDRTRTIAFDAASIAKQDPRSQSAWPSVAEAAADSGLEVVGYTQSPAGVIIHTRTSVQGTWLIGPIRALSLRKPLNTAFFLDTTVTSTG